MIVVPPCNSYITTSNAFSLVSPTIVCVRQISETLQQTSTSQTIKYPNAIKLIEYTNKILSFEKMKQGWNGYDAEPISHDVTCRAIQFLNELGYSFPQVFPTGRNSIQFEHFVNDDNLVEIEVFADRLEYFSIIKGKEMEGLASNVKEAAQILNQIYG